MIGVWDCWRQGALTQRRGITQGEQETLETGPFEVGSFEHFGLERPFNMAAMIIFTLKCPSEGDKSLLERTECVSSVPTMTKDWRLVCREIAFSASLVESGDKSIGPFSTHFTITYKNVFTNTGNAYNPITGVFTAPLKGAYMFRVSIYGHGPTPATVSIIKNGEIVVSAYDYQPQGALSSSNGVVLILEVGDVVYVRLKAGRRIYDNESNHSTFSGFLLFPLK
ncbi:Complement C1q-like protein 4 [Anabarilius grahami]|uniref:Complement C1q-like protein 4 n=1 Tax=Anabarilius grahami TaxID=495550 RepID=A0A3N0XH88_ANAGA|nr:Complement C1q-like protein 4 [Anabarilius grahami]